MTDYTVTQVGKLAEWGSLAGVAPGKEFVDEALGSVFAGISVNSTAPGGESPFWHTHSKLEEIYIFLEGSGQMAISDEVVPVQPGTIIRVPQDVWRAVHCPADASSELKWLCVRAGGDSLEDIGQDAELDSERPFPWNK